MIPVLFLYLSLMKLRNIISTCLLAVYALVLAHNLVPHHHHSEFQKNSQHCEFETPPEHDCGHEHHNESPEPVTASCSVDNHQQNHAHTFCSFDEKIVLTKGINLSNLFLPSSEIKYFELVQNKQSFCTSYSSGFIHDPHCRDVQLRGPPQFS